MVSKTIGLFLMLTATLRAELQCGQMNPGQTLQTGQSFWSCGQKFELTLQGDGNLVEYMHTSSGKQPLWSSATNVLTPPGISSQCLPTTNPGYQALCGTNYGYGKLAPGGYLAMQTDGNVVLYDASGNPSWATMTGGYPGSTLNLQASDGNLAVYHGDPAAVPSPAVWSWFTGCVPQMSVFGGGNASQPYVAALLGQIGATMANSYGAYVPPRQ